MRLISFIAVVLIAGCASTSHGAGPGDPRLDGSSDASFIRSYAKVVRPLAAGERRQFALALFGLLLGKECLSSNALIELMFLPVSTDRPANLRTCRDHLDGMSYRDIIDAQKAREKELVSKPNAA